MRKCIALCCCTLVVVCFFCFSLCGLEVGVVVCCVLVFVDCCLVFVAVAWRLSLLVVAADCCSFCNVVSCAACCLFCAAVCCFVLLLCGVCCHVSVSCVGWACGLLLLFVAWCL